MVSRIVDDKNLSKTTNSSVLDDVIRSLVYKRWKEFKEAFKHTKKPWTFRNIKKIKITNDSLNLNYTWWTNNEDHFVFDQQLGSFHLCGNESTALLAKLIFI